MKVFGRLWPGTVLFFDTGDEGTPPT